MSRAANLVTQCYFLLSGLFSPAHMLISSLTLIHYCWKSRDYWYKRCCLCNHGLIHGLGRLEWRVWVEVQNWKARKKSRGEEISQKNTGGRIRAGSNMKPCHNFLKQNFAPNSQGCRYFHVHPTCFQLLFLKLHKYNGKPANLKNSTASLDSFWDLFSLKRPQYLLDLLFSVSMSLTYSVISSPKSGHFLWAGTVNAFNSSSNMKWRRL